MLSALLITLREGLEVTLIIGIVLVDLPFLLASSNFLQNRTQAGDGFPLILRQFTETSGCGLSLVMPCCALVFNLKIKPTAF